MRRASRPRACVAIVGALLIGALALLTGCVPEGAAPSASPTSTSPASPSVSVSSPAPTPSTPVATSTPVAITATCDDLGTASTREETLAGLTAQHASGFVRPAPANAKLALSCNWIQEESAGVLLLVSSAPAADVTSGLADLAGQGYDCQAAEDFGAQYCVKAGGTVETEDVVVARDGVWIYFETVNVNARAWLSEIASQILG